MNEANERGRPLAEAAPRRDITVQSPAARIASETLFGARNVLLIRHAEQDYTLRITRNGKLILTK